MSNNKETKQKQNILFRIGRLLASKDDMSVSKISKIIADEYDMSVNNAKMLVSNAKNKLQAVGIVKKFNEMRTKINNLEQITEKLEKKLLIMKIVLSATIICNILYIIVRFVG